MKIILLTIMKFQIIQSSEDEFANLGFFANDSFDSLYETEDDNSYVESFDESEGSLDSLKGNDDDEEEEEEEEDIINELF
ncbi:hypothetical protein PVL30_001312 [Lodderomyces elongisporus]|uniref:uncharacterized protein n=1 Tax=Lodderomyces elongisporus TaxID=36914 RepID=UPI00291DCD9F|nr:uncharacterized protein PVL30_001312 [Lodderomyces elongisporus]WLF77596.1 hypothetical protein PVL30_001312 [Lodderomyces elongisporus]